MKVGPLSPPWGTPGYATAHRDPVNGLIMILSYGLS